MTITIVTKDMKALQKELEQLTTAQRFLTRYQPDDHSLVTLNAQIADKMMALEQIQNRLNDLHKQAYHRKRKR